MYRNAVSKTSVTSRSPFKKPNSLTPKPYNNFSPKHLDNPNKNDGDISLDHGILKDFFKKNHDKETRGREFLAKALVK